MYEQHCTIFLDIDGTLTQHCHSFDYSNLMNLEVLGRSNEKTQQWKRKGHEIVLTTSRPEYLREATEKYLRKNNFAWSRLIMDLPTGTRYVINDKKPHMGQNFPSAVGIEVPRNSGGIDDINI